MEEIDINSLDLGIRDVVVHLRAAGFETTDSGDGVSKEQDEETLPFKHVAIHTTRGSMLDDADRLMTFVTSACWWAFPREPKIEASYDPIDGSAIIMLFWPNDA